MRKHLMILATVPVVALSACSSGSTHSEPSSAAKKATSSATSAMTSSSSSSSYTDSSSEAPSSSATSSASSASSSMSSMSLSSGNLEKAFDMSLSRLDNPAFQKDKTKAKQNAHEVCNDFKAGKTLQDELQKVGTMYSGATTVEKGQFIGMSIGAFCQDQMSKVHG